MADKARNALNAKLLKAEMLGNAELVRSLKQQIKELDSEPQPNVEEKRRKDEEDKARLKYITIAKRKLDDNRSLKQMFVKEKTTTAEDENQLFMSSCSKNADDEYEDVRKRQKKGKEFDIRKEEREEECSMCLHKQKQELVLARRNHVYICLPDHEPLTEGHCLIRSIGHCNSLLRADEDCLEEVVDAKRKLSEMFAAKKKEIIFFEYYYKGNRWVNHFTIECIPVKERYLIEARMYFKKAILECEGTWSINKKLVDLNGKCVTKAIPKGLSYFWVTFGQSNYGYAHIIEDEQRFPKYFAQEIIGGMMDLNQRKWYKPKRLSFDEQLQQITMMKTQWKKFNAFAND